MSVLDASVILKWFVSETDSEKAEKIRSEYLAGAREIVVPDLMLYEVSNALNFHPEFNSVEIKESIQTLFDIGIEIVTPTQMLIAKAIDIAKEYKVTCYDASYFALAEDLDTDLITADEKFFNKLHHKRISNIVLLKNIK